MIDIQGGGGIRATRDGKGKTEISQKLLRLAGGHTGGRKKLHLSPSQTPALHLSPQNYERADADGTLSRNEILKMKIVTDMKSRTHGDCKSKYDPF